VSVQDDDGSDGKPVGGVEMPSVVHVPAPSWFRDGLIKVSIVALVFIAGLWLFQQLYGFLITLMLSLFLGFALEPAVNWLARHGLRRGAATLLTMLLVFAAMGFFAFVIGALVVEQTQAISDDFPSYVDTVTKYINDHFNVDIRQQSDQIKNFGFSSLGGLAGNALNIVTTFIGVIFQLFTVVLFTYYFCARGPQLRRTVCSMLPPRQQNEVLRAWDLAIDKTAGFLYSRVLLGIVSTVAHYFALRVLDVPYAITLALWVGLVSQFIPTVGTYLAGALPILVALSVSPKTALWVLIFVIAYQQVENYLLAPPLTARTMQINPAVSFGAVIVGATIFGIPGAFLALPMTATGTAFASAYIKRHDLVEHESLELDLPGDTEDTPGVDDEEPDPTIDRNDA
jgi:predicted PurR-regulated permease PerM